MSWVPFLLVSGLDTFDATVLAFDFLTTSGNLFLNYVFASEEYNEFANSIFSDTFAIFLDGVNIALIPGTTDPVSINNVNGGNPYGTDAVNPDLYNNNDGSDGGLYFNIQYDGFTDVFTAFATGISVGEVHHIGIAIADVYDAKYDSGIFIQAGSFSDSRTGPNPVPEPGTLLLLGSGLTAVVGYGRGRIRK